MKIIVSAFLIFFIFQNVGLAQNSRVEKRFDFDWKFSRTDTSAALNSDYDDSDWKGVDVPHDWAFEEGISQDGAQRESGGYFGGGIGWYRKQFSVDSDMLTKRVQIEFDGVYMNSEIWINGHYLGKRPYGYISFGYELTPYLSLGANTIAVRVDNSHEPSARWYHPCGIYAPVKLVVTDFVRIARHGIYITTPEVSASKANLAIQIALENSLDKEAELEIETVVVDANQNEQASCRSRVTIPENDSLSISQKLTLTNPSLWNIETPYLYQVRNRLFNHGKLIDEHITSLGIRSIEWKTETGFWLNGQNVKLLGVSEHYEGGPVGGAWTKELLRWKLQLLKDMGCNAIRAAHNPAPEMFYDLCDELGILVMDEIFDGWKRKAPEDYGSQAFDQWWQRDLTEWIKRDRNHPSVILYSVGNETKGAVAKDLVDLCHQLDATRPVTSGHSGSEFMDVFGVNGGSEKSSFFTKARLNKPFVATEAPHTWQTRGYYRTKTWFRDGYPNKGQQPFELPDLTEDEVFHYEWTSPENWNNRKQHFNSSYDNATVRISARKTWELMRDNAWYSGHFRWTGFDYFGEAGYVHGGWPFRLFMSGALDVAGFEKDLFYFYQSQWTKRPMVHLLPGWTHPTLKKGTLVPIWVYSNADEVELFLNGKSLGKDKPGLKWDEMQCEWLVPWKAGKITAVAYNNGEEVARTEQITADAPSKLKTTIQIGNFESNAKDLAILTTSACDEKGNLYPYGENRVYYHFDGPVRLRSLENGSPIDTCHNLGTNVRRLFMGSTRAFLQSTRDSGNVGVVTAAIIGERQLLTSNRVAIDVQSVGIRGAALKGRMKIFYTTDGSKPTTKSSLYRKPFEIELGTRVRALLVRKGEILFEMEETFAKNEGLYWGNPAEQKSNEVISNGMQAEEAKFEGAKVSRDGKNFFGKGYLDFTSQEGYVKWYQENDGSEGNFTLTFRYALNDSNRDREMDLFVNGQKNCTIKFSKTGSWKVNWATVEIPCQLQAGANYIELRTTGQSAPNIDELLIQ
ncbi:glycoside hydrolase family 2 TIM barrel-domain containing protein [Labilibaculum sp.]|uniref:glycoside hydrolase family 2 TIM barrel-domain containing protein n=1 Tax=Labilibaculum sp. TaxID=2060723 RepID=UPI003566F595